MKASQRRLSPRRLTPQTRVTPSAHHGLAINGKAQGADLVGPADDYRKARSHGRHRGVNRFQKNRQGGTGA